MNPTSSMNALRPSLMEWNHIFELAAAPGPCGQTLRKLKTNLLRAAASRKDPWDFLVAAKNLPKDTQRFCLAARSADYGAHRLARMAYGLATPRSDIAKKLKAAVRDKNNREIERLEKKLALHIEAAFPRRLEADAPPRLRLLVSQKICAFRESLSRRIGREKAQAVWSHAPTTTELAARVMHDYPREWLLVTGWLRLPGSDPGLCFFSKTALAWLFHHLGFPITGDTDPFTDSRDRLRRLGLAQASVLVKEVNRTPDGIIVLTFAGEEQRPLRTAVKTGSQLRYPGAPLTGTTQL